MQKRYLLGWLSYWLGSGAIFLYVLKPMGINHLERSDITFAYFLSIGFLGCLIFGGRRLLQYCQETKRQFKWIFLSFGGFLGMMIIVRNLIPIDPEIEMKLLEMKLHFPLLKLNLGFTKIADIFFQQALIISLVLYLKENFKQKREVVGIFTFMFFLLHLPLVFVFYWTSLAFIIPSLFAGILFSTFILSGRQGLLNSFLLHEFFYIIFAIVVRLL